MDARWCILASYCKGDAVMPNLNEVKDQLRAVGIGRAFLWTRGPDLVALAQLLAPDENIEAAIAGEYQGGKGWVVATPQRVIFVNGGFLKHQSESFPYDRIGSVQTETRGLTIHSSSNSATLEKVIDVRAIQRFANHVRQKQATPRTPTTPAPASNNDVVGQLERLVQLKNQGVLTEEEFNTQKQRLLR